VAKESFLTASEQRLGGRLLHDGFVIEPCETVSNLESLRNTLLDEVNQRLKLHGCTSQVDELKNSHLCVPANIINDIRLHLFAFLNTLPNVRRHYFDFASTLLQALVGNELSMQNKVNLSIQQPSDQSSVLELHSDVWSGDSPFQVVLWVPLTDANSTNAMFLLPPEISRQAYLRAREGELDSMSKIHEAYRGSFVNIEAKFGEIVIFDSNCLHGNQLNTTNTSRWSLNCRFSSLLAPTTTPERRLGPYYSPILVRPATKMGMNALEALGLLE